MINLNEFWCFRVFVAKNILSNNLRIQIIHDEENVVLSINRLHRVDFR